jgi:hypothetical protein
VHTLSRKTLTNPAARLTILLAGVRLCRRRISLDSDEYSRFFCPRLVPIWSACSCASSPLLFRFLFPRSVALTPKKSEVAAALATPSEERRQLRASEATPCMQSTPSSSSASRRPRHHRRRPLERREPSPRLDHTGAAPPPAVLVVVTRKRSRPPASTPSSARRAGSRGHFPWARTPPERGHGPRATTPVSPSSTSTHCKPPTFPPTVWLIGPITT